MFFLFCSLHYWTRYPGFCYLGFSLLFERNIRHMCMSCINCACRSIVLGPTLLWKRFHLMHNEQNVFHFSTSLLCVQVNKHLHSSLFICGGHFKGTNLFLIRVKQVNNKLQEISPLVLLLMKVTKVKKKKKEEGSWGKAGVFSKVQPQKYLC